MNKRLKYERFNNSNDVITIDLHNGYVVIAISGYNKDEKYYTTTLFISEKSTDEWHLINNPEKITFEVDYKTINAVVLKYVSDCLEKGFFDYYIDRYDYELKCFDRGNELFEIERLGDK